jgi:hypothetical protein
MVEKLSMIKEQVQGAMHTAYCLLLIKIYYYTMLKISLQKTLFCLNRPYCGWTQSDGGSREPSDHRVKRLFVPRWHTIPSCPYGMGPQSVTERQFLKYF